LLDLTDKNLRLSDLTILMERLKEKKEEVFS
jgi:hypothetical protein